MKKLLLGKYSIKGGFFIEFSVTPHTEKEDLVTNLTRSLKMANVQSLKSLEDIEYYIIGSFDDITGELEPIQKDYLFRVLDFIPKEVTA